MGQPHTQSYQSYRVRSAIQDDESRPRTEFQTDAIGQSPCASAQEPLVRVTQEVPYAIEASSSRQHLEQAAAVFKRDRHHVFLAHVSVDRHHGNNRVDIRLRIRLRRWAINTPRF